MATASTVFGRHRPVTDWLLEALKGRAVGSALGSN
jgi:hypothetical protein